MSETDVIDKLESGMTIGIGGWGSRRKPMSLVRAILRSDLTDLTLVSYGGADIGMLCAAGKVSRVVFGFVTLDSVALEPNFRRARESGAVAVSEYDEGMLQWGLYAAGIKLPYLPTRAGLGSSVMDVNPRLQTVGDPYGSGEEFVAMPAIPLDAALVHVNRADRHGNGQVLGPDPYFDDVFALAAEKTYLSCERVVPTDELTKESPSSTLILRRLQVDGVVEAPNGAHFTSCQPDYDCDEPFLRRYAAASKTAEGWEDFRQTYLAGTEEDYQRAVARFREEGAA